MFFLFSLSLQSCLEYLLIVYRCQIFPRHDAAAALDHRPPRDHVHAPAVRVHLRTAQKPHMNHMNHMNHINHKNHMNHMNHVIDVRKSPKQ